MEIKQHATKERWGQTRNKRRSKATERQMRMYNMYTKATERQMRMYNMYIICFNMYIKTFGMQQKR